MDRSVPFKNIIMKCSEYSPCEPRLPEGFSVASYKPGYEYDWARLEYNLGDFSSPEEAGDYFRDHYMKDPDLLMDRCRFLLNPRNEVIGACIAWNDDRAGSRVSSLHWLVVDKRYRGLGLGKALCVDAMNTFLETTGLPVYIHTQPWSWKAVLLYLSLGFRLQKSDTFSNYVNEYPDAMAVLKSVVSEAQYQLMVDFSER